jgi:hypothetical protein
MANTHNRGFLPFNRSEANTSTPIVVSVNKASTIAPTAAVANASTAPKSGTVYMQFSTSGSLLLVLWEQCPNLVFLYNFPGPDEPCTPRLRTVLQCDKPVLHARVSSTPTVKGTTVAVSTGKKAVYLWNDDRELDENGQRGELAECVGIPNEGTFACRDVRWSPGGEGLLLIDKDTFCAAFEIETY